MLLEQNLIFSIVLRGIATILMIAALTGVATVKGLAQPTDNKLIIGLNCLNLNNCKRPDMENFFREAYARAGYKVEFKYSPMLRNIQLVEKGEYDAGFVRTLEAIEQSTTLIPVPYPLFHISYSAMYLREGISVQKLEDLKKYRAGVPRGHIALMRLARDKGIQLHTVKDLANAFRMLQEKRLDLVFMNKTLAEKIARNLNLLDDLKSSEPVYEVQTFHFVHKKNRYLVRKLAKAFREMHLDGTSQKLLKSKRNLLKLSKTNVSKVYF